jgi:hypothetical protein
MEDEGYELGEGELRLDSPVLVLDCVKTKEFRVRTSTHPCPALQDLSPYVFDMCCVFVLCR